VREEIHLLEIVLESCDMGEKKLERGQSRKDVRNNVNELYILFSHINKSWSVDNNEVLLTSLPNAQRLIKIIIPAGEENSIVPNALLTWILAQGKGHYHCQVNNDDDG
jgi:hypothetical protein